ncbi:NIPSNAP family protein [Vibrio salinus]|uniref:NIPSNAP family protein n=1 Tax=Vibrio salinus TaxID=2899784 RepID=UPI001E412E96|nr:NIPSNAP family protein [Vibrio salinus]MCE0495606.1 NIPSNAP family protein [Vibrio salinus]
MYQLRIYKVNKDKREAFHERFKNHAIRIMKKYHFCPLAVWESFTDDDMEFVYMLEWPDKGTMERQWAVFLADKEWIEIKRQMASETGEPVIKATGRVLIPVEYSPVSQVLIP